MPMLPVGPMKTAWCRNICLAPPITGVDFVVLAVSGFQTVWTDAPGELPSEIATEDVELEEGFSQMCEEASVRQVDRS